MSLFPKKYLFEDLKSRAYELDIRKPQIPFYIKENLKFDLFEWQKDALLNFLLFQEIKIVEEDKNPTHLLFNLATGTGKTLLMAAVILYYYKQGKNKFIFFVNQNNIVGKTEDNLTNPLHNKYLFQPNIVIDDKVVNIKKVDTFSHYDDDIQIVFTTIHALHNSVHKVKEDSLFLEQLQKDDIIMLGDEAHHLNAATKKKKGQLEIDLVFELSEKASQEQVEKSWEHTVIRLILNKGKKTQDDPNQNALVEFTATVPDNIEVQEKYLPKTIAKFDLKDFLKAGYTKEINLVSSSFSKRKRVLQALLFNWYRNEIALKYNISNFKPVILFRSKYIDKDQENNSQEDFEFFINLIKDLTTEDFNFLNEFDDEALFNITELYKKGQSRIIDIKRYMLENKLTANHIIKYLQGAFVERNCIITNSKKGTKTLEKTEAETERLLNSLEDKNNHIRAIFTVQRLTEGWDVLNLFDIVRMYEGRDSGKTETGRKAGKATTAEVQLIGRGVRYFPFEFGEKEKNKRKFDNLLNHDLRVLEEFFFHSDNNEKYINELKDELKRQNLLPEKDKILKIYELKNSFIEKNKDLYNHMKLYYNMQLVNPNKRKSSLNEIKSVFDFEYKLDAFKLNETTLNLNEKEDTIRFKQGSSENKTLSLKLQNFEKHIIWKAINSIAKKNNSILRFNNLKEELKINSINEIVEDHLLGEFPIKIIVPKTLESLENISNYEQLIILIRFFEKISFEIQAISNPYIGSAFELKPFAEMDVWYKEKSIEEETENTALEQELKDKDWYIYNGFSGTSEERNLISFLKNTMGNFEKKYEKVFLLRNEEVYKIYDFEKGRGFQPDFILFLKTSKKEIYYQVFIEPKGSDRISNDDSKWKEEFLKQISNKYGKQKPLKVQNKDYILFGLPLYNNQNDLDFKKVVNEKLEIEM